MRAFRLVLLTTTKHVSQYSYSSLAVYVEPLLTIVPRGTSNSTNQYPLNRLNQYVVSVTFHLNKCLCFYCPSATWVTTDQFHQTLRAIFTYFFRSRTVQANIIHILSTASQDAFLPFTISSQLQRKFSK